MSAYQILILLLTDDRPNKLLAILVLLLKTESDSSSPDAVDTT